MSYIFDTYRDEIMALARSIVIKYDVQNELINQRLETLGYPTDPDPTKWKYHLNLAGEYHRNDKRMQVISSDTQQTIYFDKRVLEKHPRTKADYSINGPFYKQLIDQYPTNRILIRGITRPLDINVVSKARNFLILDYDTTYIAENEVNLMRDLQEWIDIFVARWYNKDFIISDPLYPAAFLFTLHAYIPTALMNIRLKYAKTPQASQFHIWNYLSGHYNIDKYRGFLTTNQVLWLYRNIVDLRNSAGRRDKLAAMLENLLRPVGVGLERTEFIQTDSNFLETGKYNSYFSFTEFGSKDIDFSSGSLFNNRNILELTRNRALDNSDDLESDLTILNAMTERKVANRTPTKLMRAYEDGSVVAQTLETINLKMVYWVYLSAYGIYTPDIVVNFPSGETKIMDWKNAFILFVHALNRSRSVKVRYIPEIEVKGVVPLSYPTKTQLMRYVDGVNTKAKDVDYLLENPIDVLRVKNKADFEALIGKVVERRIQHELYWEAKKTPIAQSMMEALAKGTWARVKCVFAQQGTTFEDWLGVQRINDADISEREWYELAQSILVSVTGLEQVTGDMGQIQNAIVDIVERLTSYNVMFIRSGNSKRTRKIEIPNTGIHSVTSHIEDIYDLHSGANVIEAFTTLSYVSDYELDLRDTVNYDDSVHERFTIDNGVDVYFNDKQTLKRYITNAAAHLTFKEV